MEEIVDFVLKLVGDIGMLIFGGAFSGQVSGMFKSASTPCTNAADWLGRSLSRDDSATSSMFALTEACLVDTSTDSQENSSRLGQRQS